MNVPSTIIFALDATPTALRPPRPSNFGETFTSTIHVSLLLLPSSPFLIQWEALHRGVFLLVNQDRPLHATIDLSGSYHLFVNRDHDVVCDSSNHEKNLDRRSIPFFVVTIDSCSRYHFSRFGIATLSAQVWLAKSAGTVDLLLL